MAVLTAYPDPNPETATVDGYCYQLYGVGSGRPWSTIRTASGSGASDSGATGFSPRMLGDTGTDAWRTIYRSVFLFDTSSLTADANISATTIDIMSSAKQDPDSNAPTYSIYSSAPASNTALVGGDYDSMGTTAFSSIIAYSAIASGAYNTFTFNATGIAAVDKTGVTKLANREATYDAGGTTPTWSSGGDTRFTTDFAENSGTSQDPYLTVTYTIGATKNPLYILV